jgi:hypothetical protein
MNQEVEQLKRTVQNQEYAIARKADADAVRILSNQVDRIVTNVNSQQSEIYELKRQQQERQVLLVEVLELLEWMGTQIDEVIRTVHSRSTFYDISTELNNKIQTIKNQLQ